MEKFFFFWSDKRIKLIPIETKEIELCDDNWLHFNIGQS